EAMRHLPADLELLPSPLLLEQMEREAVQRRSPSAPLVAHPDLAEKPTSSSRCKKRRRGAPSCFSASEEVGPIPCSPCLTCGLQRVILHLRLPQHCRPSLLHLYPSHLHTLQLKIL
ncbi:hypothetical protein ATANTOWER_011453, partial [Ataeniobius toweri]|nr:hypothetical protein [Ataeniobius toweri]